MINGVTHKKLILSLLYASFPLIAFAQVKGLTGEDSIFAIRIKTEIENYIPNQRAFMEFYFGDSKKDVERKVDSLKNIGELEKSESLDFDYNLPLLSNKIQFKIFFDYNNNRLFSVNLLNLDKLKPVTISELNKVLIKKYGNPDLSFIDPIEKYWFKKGKFIFQTYKEGYLKISFTDKKPLLERIEDELMKRSSKLKKKLSKDF